LSTAAPLLRLHDLLRISDWQRQLPWQPFHAGVDIYRLYDAGADGPRAALLRYQPGASIPRHEHTGYEHIIVLAGEQSDESGEFAAGSLAINPPGTRHAVTSASGCIVLAIYEKPVKFLDAGAP
jgi:anti-sigma factor ChrR (cupin superfamily)